MFSLVGTWLVLSFSLNFTGVLRNWESIIPENVVKIKASKTNEVRPNLWFTEMGKTRIENLEMRNVWMNNAHRL